MVFIMMTTFGHDSWCYGVYDDDDLRAWFMMIWCLWWWRPSCMIHDSMMFMMMTTFLHDLWLYDVYDDDDLLAWFMSIWCLGWWRHYDDDNEC